MIKKVLLLLTPFVILSALVYLYNRQATTHPLALSKEAFDSSIGVDRFGKEFVFEKPLDLEMGQIAYSLIEMRSKEWHEGSLPLIPFEIHQIWVGEGPLPDDLARGAQSVRLFHKNAPYTLWTAKEYEPLLKKALGSASDSLPKELVRDIVAALILLQKGGVVIDLEAECVQPITPLLSLGDCIIGFEPPSRCAHFKRRLLLSSSVIAAVPAHPLIREWLKTMIHRAQFMTAMKQKKFSLWATQEALTTTMACLAKEYGRTLLVGPTYFCPVAPSYIREFQGILDGTQHHSTTKKVLQSLHVLETLPYSDVALETVCIHMKGGRQGKG
jgi:mannosyltransferase OCH1-like enzyme